MENNLSVLIEELIEKPMSALDYNKSVEELIKEIDGYVDIYIITAKKLVEASLIHSYNRGVDDATGKLNSAAEQYNIDYEPLIPNVPEKLQLLIALHQHNIEDYALVLRGRLRSAIESKKYLDF